MRLLACTAFDCSAGCVAVQVKPDSSVAQRSAASGKLVLLMPKEDPQQAVVDVAYLRSGFLKAQASCIALYVSSAYRLARDTSSSNVLCMAHDRTCRQE